MIALVLRIPQHALRGLDERVDMARVGWTDPEGDPPEEPGRQPLLEALPGQPAIGRAVDPAPRSARDELPGPTHELPHPREQHARIARHHDEIGGAGRVVHEEDLLPSLAAVRRPKHAAIDVRRPDVAERRYENNVRVRGIDDDTADLPDIAEPHVLPRLAGVGGHEHAAPVDHVIPGVPLSRAHPDDARVRRRERDGADGRGELILEDRFPGIPAVRGLPDSARPGPDVVHVAVARYADHRGDAPAADGRTEITELEIVERVSVARRDRRRGGGRGGGLILRSLVPGLAREWRGNEDDEQRGEDAGHERLLRKEWARGRGDLSAALGPVKRAPGRMLRGCCAGATGWPVAWRPRGCLAIVKRETTPGDCHGRHDPQGHLLLHDDIRQTR